MSAATGCHKTCYCAYRNCQISTAELIRRSMTSYLAVEMILMTHFSDTQLVKNPGLLWGIFFSISMLLAHFRPTWARKEWQELVFLVIFPTWGVMWCPCYRILGRKGQPVLLNTQINFSKCTNMARTWKPHDVQTGTSFLHLPEDPFLQLLITKLGRHLYLSCNVSWNKTTIKSTSCQKYRAISCHN